MLFEWENKYTFKTQIEVAESTKNDQGKQKYN